MRYRVFTAFRKIAKLFSGHSLRDRYPLLDRVYKKLNRRLAPSVVNVHGHRMHLDHDDSMGLAVREVYEPAETQLVFDLIKPGYIVLDIGANIGYYSLIFLRLVGEAGHVYAFEPDPYSFDLLSRNIAANRYSNASTFQVAVSDREGELQLHRDKFNNLDHRLASFESYVESVPVRAVRLDTLMTGLSDRSIDFVKMDIQDAEGWALEGMIGLIAKATTVQILTEYWPLSLEEIGYGATRYLRRLSELGFSLYDLMQSGSGLVETTAEQLARQYSADFQGHTNLLCRL